MDFTGIEREKPMAPKGNKWSLKKMCGGYDGFLPPPERFGYSGK